jgi:hypothetical protein
MSPELKLKSLLGQTIRNLFINDDSVIFECASGERYMMHHVQDCCESVKVLGTFGDLPSIIGFPITNAVENDDEPENHGEEIYESGTWSRFFISTERGTVEIRWLGQSNGYYSEDVSFDKLN